MRDWRAFVRGHLTLADLSPEREARIVREIAAQLEDFYREAVASGASAADAEAFAAAQIQDWPKLADDVRRADRVHLRPRADRFAIALETRPAGVVTGGLQMFAHALRDARFALRQFAKTPGFTVVALLTIALGIGATSAMFSVVNGVLLRPLPYPEPDRLVRVHEVVPQYGLFSVAPATFLDWRQQNTAFERMAAYTSSSATFSGPEGPERIQGAQVTWELFDLLRVAPAIGSGLRAEQDVPGAAPVVMLSHGLWQRRFGGDRSVVGQTIPLSGVPTTIIGVMPADFYYPNRLAEFWRPLNLNPATASRGGHFLGVVARLKPDVALERADREMKAISERLATQYPDNSANESATVVTLLDQVVGGVRASLVTLFAAVAVVILIACANVANLLLVRASGRERELAIRVALGAGRRRLIVQMLAESLVLALVGGGLGLLLAYSTIPLIQSLSAGSIPRVADIVIDYRVLAFATAASLLTGALFGLAPAWQTSRARAGLVMKEGGRSSTSAGSRYVRSGLLVAEVAMSIVLLIGAMLLLRSFANLTGVDPGFRADGVLAFQVALPANTYPDSAKRIAFFETLTGKLDALPPVQSAGLVQRLPLVGGYVLSFAVQGRPPAKPGEEPSANHRVVSPDYLKTVGIPLRRGRHFTAADTEKSKMVAIVDDAFVTRHFPDEDPIGRGIDIGNGSDGFYEIVGVAGSVRDSGLDAAPAPTMYVPFRQDVFSTMWVVVKTDGDTAGLPPAVRQVVRELDRSLPAYSMSPLTDVVNGSVAQRRFSMLLLSVFALIALFLAAVGLYGVIAYTVSQRTREIGVRMAIGARPGDVLRMVIGGGMKLVAIGVGVGLAAAVGLTRLVRTMLFDVEPFDVVSYGGTTLLLFIVAVLACYIPARRAMRVDPIVALQE